MLTSTQKFDIAVGALCLSVIVGLGLMVATDAIRNTYFNASGVIEDVQAPEENRRARGSRPDAAGTPGRPRLIVELVPRRGARPAPAAALFAEKRPITDAEATRTRR